MLADALGRFRALGRNARLYLVSNAIQAASVGAIAILYTLYLAALGYGTDFIGVTVIVATVGGGLGIIPANPLVRRFGWRAMLLASDLVGGVAILAQIVAPTTPVILLTSLGVGASVAIVFVINTPLLTAYSTPRERTALFGLNNAIAFIGGILGTLLGGALPELFGRADVRGLAVLRTLRPLLVVPDQAHIYELSLLAAGVIALPSLIPVLLMRDEPRREPALDVAALDVAAPTHPRVPHAPLRKQLAPALTVARTIASGVIGRFSLEQIVVGFGAGLFIPYVSLYFVNRLHASTFAFGALSAVLSVAVALASLLAAPISERFGRVRASVVAQAASLPFLLALGLFPAFWLAAAAYVARGALMALTNPPLQTFYMEAVPEERRVLASSASNVGFQVAWSLGAGAGGWLIAVAGYRLPFLAAAPFYAASAALLVVWFGRARR
jgi:MFS family permease